MHAVTEKIVTHELAEYATIYAKRVLSWNEQVNAITTKVNKGLNVLKRLREFVDLETLLTAYKTLVQPYFDYCSQVWGGIGSTLSDKLQRLQNRAACIITKCGYDVRSCVLLQHLNLDNLETRRNQCFKNKL